MSQSPTSPLDPSLRQRVLDRLEIASDARPTLETLQALYTSWCQRVPFDNVRKLIHLHRQDPGLLPGTYAEDFFSAWLQHGTGGTCWAGSGALLALLQSLGFTAERGVATMLVAPDLPPNHGTVRVHLEGEQYLVDTSILFGEPLRLPSTGTAAVEHPAWGVRGEQRDGRWHVRWRPLHQPEGFDCRYDSFGASAEKYVERHEGTRGWSPFNFQLTARRNRGEEVLGASFGNAVALTPAGTVQVQAIDDNERRRLLVEDFGLSEEIVAQLPPDRPTPPPPGSQSAARS